MTTDYPRSRPETNDDVLVERVTAEQVLHRAGFAPDDIFEVLADIEFPAPLNIIRRRGRWFGISTGSLMERLGGSP